MKPTKQIERKIKPVTRTTEGLRNAVFDEIDFLRKGNITPARANAVARSAMAIVSSVKLEMDYEKLLLALKKTGKKRLSPPILMLSND